MRRLDWMPDWTGETCVIVASGPSATSVPLETAKDKAKFIAINKSWELCPWADMLYACDINFWKSVSGLPDFQGLKLCSEDRDVMRDWNIRNVPIYPWVDTLQLGDEFRIGSGGNSGFQALNIALRLRCRKIILAGYDMRIDDGLHWHGAHPAGMNNPQKRNIGRWRRSIDNAAEQIAAMGVTVINVSPVSSLQNYPKMTLQEALAT